MLLTSPVADKNDLFDVIVGGRRRSEYDIQLDLPPRAILKRKPAGDLRGYKMLGHVTQIRRQ